MTPPQSPTAPPSPTVPPALPSPTTAPSFPFYYLEGSRIEEEQCFHPYLKGWVQDSTGAPLDAITVRWRYWDRTDFAISGDLGELFRRQSAGEGGKKNQGGPLNEANGTAEAENQLYDGNRDSQHPEDPEFG